MFAILPKLLATPSRIRIAKLFLSNADEPFTIDAIVKRTKTPRASARADIAALARLRFLKVGRRARVRTFVLNPAFPHIVELARFLEIATLPPDSFVIKSMRRAGTPKLIALSGSLVGDVGNRVDLLFVSDRLRDKPLASAVSAIEALLGRDMRYLALTTDDFSYRMTVRDRFLRDIFESDHRIILDRLGVS